ncbi:MerR family transcriptional regulator [Brevirhabdus pacifica]|uniref:MerR family transcriptional regulator n=1 Tax=Brevirhabdus pacifica TaxID=1267768 RepID=A0A1U7DEI9_9RHOB|nr:helix-turn-helix domain-containing protein [Brevirhabdus pacifica]APX88365.1 MerR family transcriptional regulator [Brevirhabdus pacifica]OWU79685.1 MerR family transcriptional regulator [Loktanella sp. 22II-4b]PJJ87181.1 DNA-binding transcriptional MerR regulator [Brevirhabdus pacifica]
MFSIGTVARQTGLKVPTIRYYEQVGLLGAPERTEGNQRRYGKDQVERLGFIKHARDLGFPIEAIAALIDLAEHPDRSCAQAAEIAQRQLEDVREKLERLTRLEAELSRIAKGCSGTGVADTCYVMASLADHAHCGSEH